MGMYGCLKIGMNMIKIDDRENDEFKLVCDIFLKCKISRLSVGDIEVDNIIYEHKKPADFISSIYDGRLFRQIKEMKNNYDHCYILVSGTISEIMESPKIQYNSMMAAITSCFVRGCPIIFCDNYETLCGVVKVLSEKLNDGKSRTIPIEKSSIEDDQLRLICQLPGVGEKSGQALLDRFGSPIDVFGASRDEIIKIKGIKEKTYNKIQKVLHGNLYKLITQ